MQAVDALNQRYGRNTVQFASSGINKSLKMLQSYKFHALPHAGVRCRR
jgi:hypothetical protein